jgi:hypothetical protein
MLRVSLLCLLLVALAGLPASAQHHGERSQPATAPPPQPVAPPPPAIIVPASSGLGPIQFSQVNYGVPAPQALTRQLRFDDDRTRASALSALGVPAEYLQQGRIPYPHSIDLAFVELGVSEDLDALLTVELDGHIVTAVLIPVDGTWRRVATLTFATAYSDVSTTPSTWLRTARSMVQHDRYRAVFRASSGSLSGPEFSEYEASLRLFNAHAVITMSFESTARDCDLNASPGASDHATNPPAATPNRARPPAGCELTQRWFQPDPLDPWKKFTLVTATGHLTRGEKVLPYLSDPGEELARLRQFSCQPFVFSDTAMHFQPTAASAACRSR